MSDGGSVLGEALLTANPTVSVGEAEEIAAACYGVRGDARSLSGEKDRNFLIRRRDGQGFLLKVVHPGEDRAITAMQSAALLHVARVDPQMPVQRVVATLAGEADGRTRLADGTECAVRLVTFTEGLLQSQLEPSASQRRSVGAALARLQRALEAFSHPADGYTLIWDLKHAAALRPLLSDIADREGRALLVRHLDHFADRVAPRLAGLRAQVVHNDLNPGNIVVDAADPMIVRGLLDFGDIVRTAVVVDVAVGAAYQLSAGTRPLEGALDFLQGFTQVKTLQAAETELLFDLIVLRLVMRLLITAARAVRVPSNSEYILRNAPHAWAQLHQLSALPRQHALDAIGGACDPAGRP